MGKVEYSGKIVEYLPENFPRLPDQGKTAVYNACVQLTKDKAPVIPPNVRKITGLGRTSSLSHLTKLVKEKYLTLTYAKVRFENNTVICGVYKLTKKTL